MSEAVSSEGLQVEFWTERHEISERAVQYAAKQRDNWLLKAMGQLALPIETAMDDEEIVDDLPQNRSSLPVPERTLHLVRSYNG